jgi:hypothetical protein
MKVKDDPTLDPVELERRLRAEAALSETGEEKSGDLTLLSKLAVVASVALVGIYLVVWASAVQSSGGPEGYVRATDFVPVFAAGIILREGDGPLLYNLERQRRVLARFSRAGGGYPNPQSSAQVFDRTPFEALLVAPFPGLPPWVTFAAWTLAAGLALGLAVGLMDSGLPVSRPVGWAMSLAACSYLPAIRALMLGHNTLFALMGLCGTYLALKRGYEGWAAVSMLLVALRPQVLPVVALLLLLQKRWKTIAWLAFLLAALAVGIMPVLGAAWPLQYLELILRSPSSAINGRAGDWVPGLPTPLFVALSLAAVGALVYAQARGRDVPPDEELAPYEESYDLVWALAGVVAVLTSLYLNPQDLTLLVFPAWILGAYATLGLWGTGLSRLWLVLLWAGYGLAPLSQYWSANGAAPALAIVPTVVLLAVAIALLAWQAAPAEEV